MRTVIESTVSAPLIDPSLDHADTCMCDGCLARTGATAMAAHG